MTLIMTFITRYEELMINEIVEELFFPDNEFNYHDADSLRWYEELAMANNASFDFVRQKYGIHHSNFFLFRNFMSTTCTVTQEAAKMW
jgi:hypothetical protein